MAINFIFQELSPSDLWMVAHQTQRTETEYRRPGWQRVAARKFESGTVHPQLLIVSVIQITATRQPLTSAKTLINFIY